MQISIGPTAAFHNFMTFDRGTGGRIELRKERKKEIKQCYCVTLLLNLISIRQDVDKR